MKIFYSNLLDFLIWRYLFLPLYNSSWSRQKRLSCWSWHRRTKFLLLVYRTLKLLTKSFKLSSIDYQFLLKVMKKPENNEDSYSRSISDIGRLYTPSKQRTVKQEISRTLSYVWDYPAHNRRVDRQGLVIIEINIWNPVTTKDNWLNSTLIQKCV